MRSVTVLVLAGLSVFAAARPETTFSHETDDSHHEQLIDDDNIISGSYRWTSPEGLELFVRYVADKDGFRIVESNVVPASSLGVLADGQQGAFGDSLEEADDDDDADDSDDDDDFEDRFEVDDDFHL
ncbi:cuticle protein 16.8-like [Eriocheir sinensis]|uniref:cuticle protein 16.8-like n=1 Tax=Eriocheir sinensis TaxID=95602 RepID=UPI0021C962FA|nr:cuticle protein 16.8-like [Eriocheir sinensis]